MPRSLMILITSGVTFLIQPGTDTLPGSGKDKERGEGIGGVAEVRLKKAGEALGKRGLIDPNVFYKPLRQCLREMATRTHLNKMCNINGSTQVPHHKLPSNQTIDDAGIQAL
jgi:hypothetical protein